MKDTINTTRKVSIWKRILMFLAVVGPGIITGSVDNDAGGITVYSAAGATWGYSLIWTLIPAAIILYVMQEMNARMGIVTGKGLADLIRENAGVKLTLAIFVALLLTDIMNTATEFAGVAGSMQIFGVSKYIAVPLIAIIIWFVVVKGTYKIVEKVFLVFSAALLLYIVSALLGKPDWSAIGTSIITPKVEADFGYIFMVLSIIGTTIAPWMQFYIQSSVIEKGLKVKDLKYTKWDVGAGSLVTVVVAFFIIIACAATLHVNGITTINTAADAAGALAPLAGQLASAVFAFGLFIASIFSATVLPVATAFFVCEAFGYEAGIDKKWDEAPQFYWLYTIIIIIGAVIILFPNAPLIGISIWTQLINGVLLPVILIMMMIIINKKEVMGKYTNKLWQNIIGWATIVIILFLSILMLVSLFKKH